MDKIKIYCVGKLSKLFEPNLEIDTDSFITRDGKKAIKKYNDWKEEALEVIPAKIQETEFPIKDDIASYEISDNYNSILVWLTSEEI